MSRSNSFLGCQDDVVCILRQRDQLNELAIDHLNRSQELMLTNMFIQESNEYRYRATLMERLADVESWKWVLTDLSRRLAESLLALDHERECLHVVIQRVTDEIQTHCKDASMPGALEPFSDAVEKAIMQECKYLSHQKREFTSLLNELQRVVGSIEKVKKRIDRDIENKKTAISIDERTLKDDLVDQCGGNRPKKNSTSLAQWEGQCQSLKRAGLRALCDATVTRQQLRGARVQLSVDSQAYAVKVDAVLRRRLHANEKKVEELEWQRKEITRDIEALDGEIESNEDSLADNERHVRRIEARLAGRRLRPPPELTMDQAQEALRAELAMLKRNNRALVENMNEIAHLKHRYCSMLIRIEDVISDVTQVVSLDAARVAARRSLAAAGTQDSNPCCHDHDTPANDEPLPVIMEEQED